MKNQICILVTAFRIVGTLVPPQLRLGLIDQTECVVLGAVIGIVVAVTSHRNGPRCSDNEP